MPIVPITLKPTPRVIKTGTLFIDAEGRITMTGWVFEQPSINQQDQLAAALIQTAATHGVVLAEPAQPVV